MASVKLEVGKFYRTSDGRKVGPMEKKGWEDGYPWTADNVFNYFDDEGMGQNPALNLIAEWTEEPTTPIIKEVTTRTVVIGRQNKVVIHEFDTAGNPCLWVDFPKGADEIRAAALTMLQIADVLEGRE